MEGKLGCLQPEGAWLRENGAELRKKINEKLDKVADIDRVLLRSREHAIGVLLAYIDNHQDDFIKYVEAI